MTLLPDWKEKLNTKALPPLQPGDGETNVDVFARWSDAGGAFPDICNRAERKHDVDYVKQVLPYTVDHLRKQGWTCGSPLVVRSERLQIWCEHPNVFIIDLGAYAWSRTLKDPRTWAIINVALDRGFRHLAAWTAGNAGLSLAMMVWACNRFLPAEDRLHAYALYDQTDESVSGRVIETLESWECALIPVPNIKEEILPPAEIRNRVKGKANLGPNWADDAYWDVTDGWEAVGMVMYRLLFAQVIRDLQPTHIIAPAGTGNLLLSIILAVRDCVADGVTSKGDVNVFGAAPAGDSLFKQIEQHHTKNIVVSEDHGDSPLMPKIANTYSALLECIRYALKTTQEVTSVIANQLDQKTSAKQLFTEHEGLPIRAEPTSMAAFAVFPKVCARYLERVQDERVLLVNSGYGLLSQNEEAFMCLYHSK